MPDSTIHEGQTGIAWTVRERMQHQIVGGSYRVFDVLSGGGLVAEGLLKREWADLLVAAPSLTARVEELTRLNGELETALREQTMTVGWALDYSEDEFGDRGQLHEFDPDAFAQARENDAKARALLARIESSQHSEGGS